jgi:peptidoglycan/LPS O-acetylase OafA/YrhL
VSTGRGGAQDVGAAGLESGPTLHFPCFDAFRFFGMTLVLLMHAGFATRPWVRAHLPEWVQAILQRFDVGLAIFFTISGFLLFRPFIARLLAGKPQMRARTFLRRRALRVFPGYWFALTFCVLFLGQLLGGVKSAFLYYSLLFPFANADVALGGGPGQEGKYAIPQAWSLTTEFGLYLLLPVVAMLLVWLSAKKSREVQVRNTLVICAGLYVCGQLFRIYVLAADPSWARLGLTWTPNWLDFFAIGMVTATFSAAHEAGLRLPSPLRYLGDHPGVSWSVAGAVALSFATFSPPDTPGAHGAEYGVRWFMFGVFVIFFLAPAMFGDQRRGRVRRVLASKPLVMLGTVSLGVYLFHLAIMSNVQEWLAPAGTSSAFYGSLPVVFTLTFVGSVILAFLSYYAVEKPFLRLKDQPFSSLWRRRAPTPKVQQ